MDRLDQLENQSIYILREAYNQFKSLTMLWSIGKDSTVMLWLTRKAFFGHVPFPLVHIDTSYKIPEMIEYRDRLAIKYKLNMVVGRNKEALKAGKTFPTTHPGETTEHPATGFHVASVHSIDELLAIVTLRWKSNYQMIGKRAFPAFSF